HLFRCLRRVATLGLWCLGAVGDQHDIEAAAAGRHGLSSLAERGRDWLRCLGPEARAELELALVLCGEFARTRQDFAFTAGLALLAAENDKSESDAVFVSAGCLEEARPHRIDFGLTPDLAPHAPRDVENDH